MRVLGIDYGAARIGIALGDTDSRIASPWQIIENRDFEVVEQKLLMIIQTEGIKTLVIGLPRRLHDQQEESAQVQEVRNFITRLSVLGLPIVTENETWSSQLAARYVQDRGEKGKRDDLAAVVILQSYLDRYGLSS